MILTNNTREGILCDSKKSLECPLLNSGVRLSGYTVLPPRYDDLQMSDQPNLGRRSKAQRMFGEQNMDFPSSLDDDAGWATNMDLPKQEIVPKKLLPKSQLRRMDS